MPWVHREGNERDDSLTNHIPKKHKALYTFQQIAIHFSRSPAVQRLGVFSFHRSGIVPIAFKELTTLPSFKQLLVPVQ